MPRNSKRKEVVDSAKVVPDDTDDSSNESGCTLESAVCRITESFTASFNKCVDKLISSIEMKLSTQLGVHSGEIFTLSQRIDKLEKRNSDLQGDNDALRLTVKAMSQQMARLEGKLDDVGQETRSTTLLVHGVRDPGATPQEIKSKVVSMLNEKIVAAKIELSEISVVEKMGSSSRASPGTEQATGERKVSPILLKFTTKEARDRVLRNRRYLKNSGTSITEHLTPLKSALLKQANELVRNEKLGAAWSHDGKIIVKDKSNKILNILSTSELDMYC